ncbi:hypothetical protein BT96DRAFT_817590 [Gymnopus androsaceus JB14]|uniref:Reverse transcriptase zinc-binding domain-containing protein n=1 Tax=Gymnopus androsaceus JB14 TaxID=1447944 RepID=A0A6A4HRG1_9AGAR|nr:hypothetical protein BT96DRAFT_817590 [Gymnopus androsaceus JB14]
MQPGTAEARAGGGAWYSPFDDRNAAIAVPKDERQSAPTAAAIAVLYAILNAPTNKPLRCIITNEQVLKNITEQLTGWNDRGFHNVKDARVYKALLSHLRAHGAPTIFCKVDKKGNLDAYRGSMSLAEQASLGIDQSLAYKTIKGQNKAKPRPATEHTIGKVQHDLHVESHVTPMAEHLWKSIRDPELPQRIRDFLWKSMHDAHRVGRFWKHIPECEERMMCAHCNEVESLEHILLECDRPWRRLIWEMAKSLWPKTPDHGSWKEPNLGIILGTNLLEFKDAKGKSAPGIKRLYKILITESAHLIWKLHCEAVIDHENEDVPDKETYNRLCQVLSQRLARDQSLTYKPRWKTSAKPRVLQMWNPIIKDPQKLPLDWIGEARVLVGIGPFNNFRQHPP